MGKEKRSILKTEQEKEEDYGARSHLQREPTEKGRGSSGGGGVERCQENEEEEGC